MVERAACDRSTVKKFNSVTVETVTRRHNEKPGCSHSIRD